MGGALWPTELSRHGWPPRDRTARYLRIRQAPSTSWVVASGCGRSRTCKAEARPGSSRVPSPDRIAHPRAERARIELARPKLNCFRGRSRHQSGCLSMAEDGELESQGLSGPHPLSRRGPPPGDFISHERRAENSNPTPKCALVSGEARHPGRFALHDYLVPFRGFEPRTS